MYGVDVLGRVYNILDGKKEAERVLFNDPDLTNGFLILPDLKWDQTSMSALYLVVLIQDRSIKSLRDLTKAHVPLLQRIRREVFLTVKEKYGVEPSKLRMFIHYQPSYCESPLGNLIQQVEPWADEWARSDHFHVHVVHLDHENLSGMMVGQARLLEDIISLVR